MGTKFRQTGNDSERGQLHLGRGCTLTMRLKHWKEFAYIRWSAGGGAGRRPQGKADSWMGGLGGGVHLRIKTNQFVLLENSI